MLLCSECSSPVQVNASFCPSCGVAFAQPAAAAEQKAAETVAQDEARRSNGNSGIALGSNSSVEALHVPENIAGAVAYITIIPAVIFLFLEPFKRNLFVRFHSFQHLFLWVAGFVAAIAAGVLGSILQLIPFMRVLMFPFAGLITLAWIFVWLLLVVKAYQHEMFKLPVIGDVAEEWAMREQ
jgi:uncharacterized membrane protein